MKKSLIFIFLLLCTVHVFSYTEKNMLEKQADVEKLKEILILNQEWVTYPDYTDRSGWDTFLGSFKEEYIRRGEKLLDYQWRIVKATDYLAFERTGNRTMMEDPFESNNRAIAGLLLAELAEGKGRFIDPLIDGVYHSCEMTSWALAAHVIVQPSHRSLPVHDYPVIDLVSGDVDSDELKGFAALMYKQGVIPNNGRDIFRTFSSISVEKELRQTTPRHEYRPFTWYPETEFCYLSTKEGLFLAAKGGYNDESHNHNDAGTCSVWMNNTPVLIDAGVGTYTRQTFSSERYNIWTMQSNYHNLPMINGIPQKYGKKYKATDVKAGKNSFEANIGTAYPEEAKVEKWIRSYSIKGRQAKITDSFELKETIAPNVVNFMTWGEIDSSEKGKVYIHINKDTKAALLYDATNFELAVESIELTDTRLSKVWGNKIYRLSFKAKQQVKKGNYSFTIKSL